MKAPATPHAGHGEHQRVLIFDPFSGVSGDMILGALLDLGLESDWLVDLVNNLPVNVRLDIQTTSRGALQARSVTVSASADEPHRRLTDVLTLLSQAQIAAPARAHAEAAFRRLAEVEGAIHGLPPEDVHFHELGAADAIVDITAVCAAIDALQVNACFTRPVALGRGWVESQHGRLPVPAPATLKLLEGLPSIDSDLEGELTTPTGAVLLSVLTQGRQPPGAYVPIASGYGAGARDPETHPNCLRLVLAETESADAIFLLQADIDDMPPEYIPPILDALFAAGAADVSSSTVQMKKGRPGIRIEALVAAAYLDGVSQALLAESTTLGLRFWRVQRQTLPRSINTIEWRGYPIRIKVSIAADGHIRRKPEYDDVLHAARVIGIPAFEARQAIERMLQEAEGKRD